MRHRKTNARGVTLIEAAVVVTFSGLLIAALLPVLPRARQQARVAKCLANLRQITQAAAGYVIEDGTLVFAFPFGYRIDGYDPSFNFATEFIWGGGVPDKQKADWDDSQGMNPADYRTDTYCITPAQRPLNNYLVPGVWWSDPDRVRGDPARHRRPMLLPDFFQCPCDSTAHIPMAGATDPNLPDPGDKWYPTWQWWGTSYAINWYWVYYHSLEPGPPSFYEALISRAITQGLLEEKMDRGASEFVLFYENRMNYAMEMARPRGYEGADPPRCIRGWHGEKNVHAAGFLDGSARYRDFDTRYVDGPGWTTWPSRPWSPYWEPYEDY